MHASGTMRKIFLLVVLPRRMTSTDSPHPKAEVRTLNTFWFLNQNQVSMLPEQGVKVVTC